MSQEWQRGREGERLRETDGESGVGDLQRRAEEEGSVTTHGMGREGEPSSTSGTAARGGNFFAFRLDSTTRWRILPLALMAVEFALTPVRGWRALEYFLFEE